MSILRFYYSNFDVYSVAVVNQAGILKPIGEGETKVEVAMVRNEHLRATSSVLVLKPHAMGNAWII